MDGGRVVAEGTSTELKRQIGGQRLNLVLAGARGLEETVHLLGARIVPLEASRLTIGGATDGSAAHVRALRDAGDPPGRAGEGLPVHSVPLDRIGLEPAASRWVLPQAVRRTAASAVLPPPGLLVFSAVE